MSFIITLYVREGIVMASDSRLTLSARRTEGDREIIQMGVGVSDSIYKTFVTLNGVGISAFGAPDVGGVPITGFIESFISDEVHRNDLSVTEVPDALIDYFKALDTTPDTGFLVAGYGPGENGVEQHVYEALVKQEKVARLNKSGQPGAAWRGVTDVLTRLLMQSEIKRPDGTPQVVPHYPVQFGFFTLQDAIDYARYAVEVTKSTMRFQTRPKSVGGPVDILVIKPEQAFWVQVKELESRG